MREMERLRELQASGHCCAQVMVAMGLYLRGETNEQLVQAVGGLCGGMGKGLCCGALTGAACALSLFDAALAKEAMLPALVEWFEDEHATVYGSVNCDDILERDRANRFTRCPQLIENTYFAMKDILLSFGFAVEDDRD